MMSFMRSSLYATHDRFSIPSQNEKNQSLINHLFLPHHLPSSSDEDYLIQNDHRNEYEIVAYIDEFLGSLKKEESLSIFSLLRICTQRWMTLQNPATFSVTNLQTTIATLAPEQFLPLYFHKQNAAILIEIDTEHPDEPLVSAWQVLLPTATITSSMQIHKSCFPAPTFRLPNNQQLKSQVHCELLVDFMTNTIEYDKTKKSSYAFYETRDVPISHYVCQWWLSQFREIREETSTKSQLQFQKKHRDQIRWKSSLLPFRRAGLWMVVKTVFHSILAKRFGHDGTVIYKVLITSFLMACLRKIQACPNSQICSDLLLHCLRKIARRVVKVERLVSSIESVDVLQWTEKTLHNLKEMIEKNAPPGEWQKTFKIQNMTARRNAMMKRTEDHLDNYQHPCTTIKGYLDSNLPFRYRDHQSLYLHRRSNEVLSDTIFNEHELPTITSTSGYSTGASTGVALTCAELWIYSRFERWIDRVFSTKNRSHSFQELIVFFEDYQRTAMSHYCSKDTWDPAGYSRYIIAALTIIQILHQKLCEQDSFGRLKSHRIEIPHLPEIFPYLVLPNRDDMIRARSLYDYFIKFKQEAYPDLLTDVERADAFGVHFASGSKEMCNSVNELRTQAQQDRQDKIEVVTTAKALYEALMESIKDSTCECVIEPFVSKCDRCKTIQRANRIAISIYECPIPNQTESALAVIFELQIPPEIGCYRDILWRFINRNDSATTNGMYEWLRVSSHSGKLRPFCRGSYQARIKLVSATKSISQSHYSAPRPVGVTPIEDYLYENSLAVQISPTKPTAFPAEQRLLTPQLNCADYKPLQFSLDSTEFAQNRAIARLSDCPSRLKPSQFIEFGSFRSGHRLQWWNLLCALESESLPFDEESVTVLIMHAILQYGPIAKTKTFRSHSWCSESHRIILDDDFLDELLFKLHRRLMDCQDNWQGELVLIILVLLATRLLTLCNTTRVNHVSSLVLKCRETGEKWIKLITECLQSTSTPTLIEADILREKLVIIAIAGLLTFSTHEHRLDHLLSSDEHVISLLKLATTMHDNTILKGKDIRRSSLTKYLLRFTERMLISIQPILNALLSRDSFKILNEFSTSHWPKLREKSAILGKWTKRSRVPYNGWYDGQYDNILVSINCVDGTFLIDGTTVGFLPERITSNPLYTRVFGDHVFEVQSSGTESNYITKHGYHGSSDVHYEFSFADQYDRLKVHEQHVLTNEKFELLPSSCFEKEFPDILVSNYSHWMHHNTNEIEFRAIRFHDPEFLHEKQFVLDMKTGLLTSGTGTKMLTLVRQNSPLFESIYQQYFIRLDDQPYVYMFRENLATPEKNSIIHIHLSRLGIAFKYDMSANMITSREYPDMKVDQHQWFGTLTGLTGGLLLSPIQNTQNSNQSSAGKKLIVPFGQVRITRACDNDHHQEVRIERKSLSSSFLHQYFVFGLNDRLRILQSTDSPTGWLFLALLHARTSHALPDEYTGLTGMERAFQLLNSAGCWSDQPYNALCLNILLQIASITPKVTFYPEHLRSMIKVEYIPQSLPYSLQHFGYYLIAKRLFTASQQLHFMHPSHDSKEAKAFFESNQYNERVLIKLYWDYRDSYNPEARLSQTMEAEIVKSLSDNPYQYLERLCPTRENYTPKSLTDDLYRQGNVNLKDSAELNCFPLRRWLTEDYQLKNSWIGLVKFIQELKSRRTENETSDLERFELLLKFLHYISNSCSLQPYYLQMLKSILTGTDHPSGSITYPQWIDYKNIEETSVQSHRIILPRRLYQRGRMEALQEIHACYHQNTFYTNNALPTWNINTHAINRQLESWHANARLRSCIDSIQTRFADVLVVSLDRLAAVPPQRFAIESFGDHFHIQLHTSNEQINPILLERAQKKFLYAHSDYFITAQPTHRMNQNQKSYPNQIFPSVDQSINPIGNIVQHFKDHLNESWKSYQLAEEHDYLYPTIVEIEKSLNACREESRLCWYELETSITDSYGFLFKIGSVARVTPTSLIQLLLQKNIQSCQIFISPSVHLIDDQCTLLGGMMVNWIVEQQYERALYYATHGQQGDFQKEILNVPHSNWIPGEHIPWMILELEMNMTIRAIQVEVTKHMIEPKHEAAVTAPRNIVMQMNMGEGKTSVILPMLALSLCHSSSSLVRIIVLKALFPMNYQSLRYKLGGLLNRRVLPFACRRDMNFNEEQVRCLFNRLQDGLVHCDTVLTTPEDLLSFDLLTIDKCRRSEYDTGHFMLTTNTWLKRFARDILDESDEILHVKYQLIYSVGSQKQVDGGMERWKTIQSILFLTKKHAADIAQQYPDDTFYRPSERLSHFPELRLLTRTPFPKLCESIVDEWLSRQSYRQLDQQCIRSFLLDTSVSVDSLGDQFSHNTLQLFLTVRGLLSSEVLFVALKKRYRVNYGINPSPKFKRLMAVPFRAKDVAAENTEFGHPDVAMVLTQLSYYYQGLNDAQLLQCLENLNQEERDPDGVYDDWISHEDPNSIPRSIQRWKSINLKDSQQRTLQLFPNLRHNMLVINYFLNHFVFAREAKQFPYKLVASSWDLASASRAKMITGFSGTNDTQLLLPMDVQQLDLPQLRKTDALVLNNLLQPENNHYTGLPTAISSEEILEKIVQSKPMIQVILDVGALLLGGTNRQIAIKWLDLCSKDRIEYAIYFEGDEIFVCDRLYNHHPFLSSPASERLARCIFYLDEIHTRGTDFKFPQDFRAAVTLGNGLTKDRLVQACMRMRQLGKHHWLSFWSSHEVHQQIQVLKGKTNASDQDSAVADSTTLIDLLRWVYDNTANATWDGLHHWAAQSLSYQRKTIAFQTFDWSKHDNKFTRSQMEQLARNCLENETIELKSMYGPSKTFQTLIEIYANRYRYSKINGSEMIHGTVLKRLENYGGSRQLLTHLLDEEQQRELEQELEEERQQKRPRSVHPCEPILHEEIFRLCDTGSPTMDLSRIPRVFQPISEAFVLTSFYDQCQPKAWRPNFWITTEFQRVTQTSGESMDSFLRPPRWILLYRHEHIILLSPLEANIVIGRLHSSSENPEREQFFGTSLRLLLPRTRKDQSILVNSSPLIVSPSVKARQFMISVDWLAELFVFNGTLYFESIDEQTEYCHFLGLCPKPRTASEEEAFENGWITVDGYVTRAIHRQLLRINRCRFSSNPLPFVRKLLEARNNAHAPLSSHVGDIILNASKCLH